MNRCLIVALIGTASTRAFAQPRSRVELDLRTARSAAADHSCVAVRAVGDHVERLDPAYFTTVFAADPAIATCLDHLTARPDEALRATNSSGAPAFVTLDRMSRASFAGAEAAYLVVPNGTGVIARLDGHVQYVDPASGVGGYLTVPLSIAADFDGSATGLGDIEVGAILARDFSPNVGIVVHAGITAPTAAEGAGAAVNAFTAFARATDLSLAAPDQVSLRLGVSPTFRQGAFFARLDLGFDVSLSNDDAPVDQIVRINAGVGADVGVVAITVETTNLCVVNTGGSAWLHTGALGARFNLGQARPYVALGIPLDGNTTGGPSAALTVGLDALFR